MKSARQLIRPCLPGQRRNWQSKLLAKIGNGHNPLQQPLPNSHRLWPNTFFYQATVVATGFWECYSATWINIFVRVPPKELSRDNNTAASSESAPAISVCLCADMKWHRQAVFPQCLRNSRQNGVFYLGSRVLVECGPQRWHVSVDCTHQRDLHIWGQDKRSWRYTNFTSPGTK